MASRVCTDLGDPVQFQYRSSAAMMCAIQAKLAMVEHEPAEWEYIEDAIFINVALVTSMFKGYHSRADSTNRFDKDDKKLGDSPSPLFSGALYRMQEDFWPENRRLPTPDEIRREVLQGCDFSGDEDKEVPARDRRHLSLINKRDSETAYFEADEECKDPEAVSQSYACSDYDLEKDNGERASPLCGDQLADPNSFPMRI